MVEKDQSLYLLAGQDSPLKAARLRELQQRFLPPELLDFNFERVYAHDLTLESLQEKLLCLPVKAKKRLLLINNAERLKAQLKSWLLEYLREPARHVILIMDVEEYEVRDEFLQQLARMTGQPLKRTLRPDTFLLSRQIDERQSAASLRTLRTLLDNGEAPERILGGLRYAFENRTGADASRTATRMKLLLACDSDIKTGRIHPEYALEKLVVGLCCLRKA